MPHGINAKKVSLDEFRQYRRRQSQHQERYPDYDDGFRRPDALMAEAIWSLLAPTLPVKLEDLAFQHADLTDDERRGVETAARQAVAVALACVLRAGHEHRTVTVTQVFDSLAAAFSDHYRRIVEITPARTVRDMRRESATNIRRDLLLNGLRLRPLMRVAWSDNPLYSTTLLDRAGRTVDPKPTPERAEFEALMRQANLWSEPAWGLRLLGADEPLPPRPTRQRVCGEQAYNVVQLGKRSEQLLDIQEQACLLFNMTAFREDYRAAEDALLETGQQLRGRGIRPDAVNEYQRHSRRATMYGLAKKIPKKRRDAWLDETRSLIEHYDQAAWMVNGFKAVNRQVTPLVAQYEQESLWFGRPISVTVPIKSGFTRVVNRRYQPTHFWPLFATPKEIAWLDDDLEIPGLKHEVLRSRWFQARSPVSWYDRPCPLVSVDVASSQTQILAILLGLKDLEHISQTRSFKEVLAEIAWQRHRNQTDPFRLGNRRRSPATARQVVPPYTGSDDERLVRTLKDLWMRVLYGSKPGTVTKDQRESPLTYGRGMTRKNAEKFLEDLSWYGDSGGVGEFLHACRTLADLADDKGVILTDPLDGAKVQWNPIQQSEAELNSDGLKIMMNLPGRTTRYCSKAGCPAPLYKHDEQRKKKAGQLRTHIIKKRFHPNAKKDSWPLDRRKLRNLVAPCLIHMLDAYFSSLVLFHLHERGVRDVVGVHDAWLMPEIVLDRGQVREGGQVLQEVLQTAAKEWFTGLGPVYDDLVAGLGKHPTFGPFVRKIRAQWKRRVKAQHWPRFHISA